MKSLIKSLISIAIISLIYIVSGCATGETEKVVDKNSEYPPLGALEPIKYDEAKANLGKHLFFESRLSGDAAISCATCHDPTKGWADGIPLSLAYPGSMYFRNSKTFINSSYARYYYWDGRLSGKDPATMVRDAITETHFLNMDGRLMFLRLQQVPEYVKMFKEAYGGESSFGKVLKAVAEFQKTIVSKNVPFDKYMRGDKNAMSSDAIAGLTLFRGKAKCIQCHNGSYFSDNLPHKLGVPHNEEIINDPLRHITLRSVFKYLGVDNYENVKQDVGHYTVTKMERDRGAYITPTLREVSKTGPYMHNGMIKTLDDVIEFYNRGGGEEKEKDIKLVPLNLSPDEKKQLKEFLIALSGDNVIIEPPAFKPYQLIENWTEVPN